MAKPLSKLFALLKPKRRWAQFSLRTLLAVMAGICIFLGGRHLLETYGQRIEVDQSIVGRPIKVRARYIRLFGPPDCFVIVELATPTGDVWFAVAEPAVRSWLCYYETEQIQMKPVHEPCQLSLTMGEILELGQRGGKPERRKIVKRITVDVHDAATDDPP
jgi:hypothetical protein